jgi:hypothetical protein
MLSSALAANSLHMMAFAQVLPLIDASSHNASAIEKLNRLHTCSRSRGSSSGAELHGLFSDDADFVRFVLSGSFAPLFLQVMMAYTCTYTYEYEHKYIHIHAWIYIHV